MIPFFNLARQHKELREQLLDVTDEVLRHGRWIDGPYTDQLERWLCEYTGKSYAITVSNGTMALEAVACAIRPWTFGEETPRILMPNLTFKATANAFVRSNFYLHLADTDRWGTLSIPKDLDMTDPMAICVVGLWGHNRHSLSEDIIRAELLGKTIIEDAAQSWTVGVMDSSSAISTISFDPTKNLPSTGNGGAVLTDNWHIASAVRSWRANQSAILYGAESAGTNSRITELEAAHLLVRTNYLRRWESRRREIAEFWWSRFKNLPVTCLTIDPEHRTGLMSPVSGNSHQKFTLLVDRDRNDFVNHLNLLNIQTRVHYPYTIEEVNELRPYIVQSPGPISASKMLSMGTVSLPIYPELTDSEIEEIARSVTSFFV
jgi:dTDP-4-amino-4,6-dideoxygalactose transaminase